MMNYESNGYYQQHSHDNGEYNDPNPESTVRTLFIHGFPADVLDREVFNLIRTTCAGFDGRECLHILRKSNEQHPVTVFAKFKDRAHAFSALERLNNFDFDIDLPSERLRCFFAKSDLNQKNELKSRLPSSAKRNSDFQGNYHGSRQQQQHHQHQRYSEPFPSRGYSGGGGGGGDNRPYYDNHNSGDVRLAQPCKTLFIGSLCPQNELEEFFNSLAGFVRLKIGKPGSYAFAEFESVDAAHTVLRTCDKHPVGNGFIRLSFARKDAQ
jgi:hypothetical protein